LLAGWSFERRLDGERPLPSALLSGLLRGAVGRDRRVDDRLVSSAPGTADRARRGGAETMSARLDLGDGVEALAWAKLPQQAAKRLKRNDNVGCARVHAPDGAGHAVQAPGEGRVRVHAAASASLPQAVQPVQPGLASPRANSSIFGIVGKSCRRWTFSDSTKLRGRRRHSRRSAALSPRPRTPESDSGRRGSSLGGP
jgi:hypothetical protein